MEKKISVSNLITVTFAQPWRQPSLVLALLLTSPQTSVLVRATVSSCVFNSQRWRHDFIVVNACARFCSTGFLRSKGIELVPPTSFPLQPKINPELPPKCNLSVNYTCKGKKQWHLVCYHHYEWISWLRHDSWASLKEMTTKKISIPEHILRRNQQSLLNQ